MAILKVSTAKATSKQALKSVLNYVLNSEKTPDQIERVTGFYHGEITSGKVYKSFMKNKEAWHKESGRLYSHVILSFHENEKITPEEVGDFAYKFCGKHTQDIKR